MKDALINIGSVPTRDLVKGNFVDWYTAIGAIQEVERTLATLLQP